MAQKPRCMQIDVSAFRGLLSHWAERLELLTVLPFACGGGAFQQRSVPRGWQAIDSFRFIIQRRASLATVVSARSESLLLGGTSTFDAYTEWLAEVLVMLHTAYRPPGHQLMQMRDAFVGTLVRPCKSTLSVPLEPSPPLRHVFQRPATSPSP
jgi:hypothetical protein